MTTNSIISQKELHDLLSYDEETGVFRWKKSRSQRVKVGNEVGSWDLYGYKTVRLDGRSYKLHRLAWFYVFGVWPAGDIDHMNGIRSDNRLSNLRDVPRKTNLENQTKVTARPTETGLIGAYYDKAKNVFYSRISQFNKSIYLGTFQTADEAHQAYLKAKRIMHVGCTI